MPVVWAFRSSTPSSLLSNRAELEGALPVAEFQPAANRTGRGVARGLEPGAGEEAASILTLFFQDVSRDTMFLFVT